VLHQRLGALLLAARRAGGRLGPLAVVPYRGYGTATAVGLKGRVLERSGLAPSTGADSVWRNLGNSLRRFTAAPIPDAQVVARLGGATETATTDPEGYFRLDLSPPVALPATGWHEVDVELCQTPARLAGAACARVLVPPAGAEVVVISDLDDTVLHSGVTNLLLAARLAFLHNARTRSPFEGVSAFYAALHAGRDGQRANPVFYVSSSPWNLYDLLSDFLRLNGILEGPLLLRAWGLDADAPPTGGHLPHKLSHIRAILSTYPTLGAVLIGDSGQHDPEVYARVVEEFPGRVRAVYIRDVTTRARDTEVAVIAAQVQAAGVPFLAVADTSAAARHASTAGLIAGEAVPSVDRERDRDAAGPLAGARRAGRRLLEPRPSG
ncbi:MAG: DUF2183 domain-containing protein, partial [Actinomycetota bacterium]|nr:DUF2183 domain-containing protein [Actinomycetota bacterium]